MHIIIQRVKFAQVEIAGVIVGKIDRGLNRLVGIADNDIEAELDWTVRKCLDLRLFPNTENNNEPGKKSGQ